MRASARFALLCFAIALITPSLVLAQYDPSDPTLSPLTPAPSIMEVTPSAPADLSEFGTLDGIDEWIPANSFNPRTDETQWDYAVAGYYTSSTGGQFEHRIPIHNGNLLVGYRVYFNDASVTNNITVRIHQYNYEASSPSVTIPFTYTSSGEPGYNEAFLDTNLTVDLREGSIDRFYSIAAVMPADTAVSFRGVRLFWKRQVAPAPLTATFTDVPTTHPLHQFVEALVDSGITAGCGGGNYCPDATLTRGQMAVFLAKALGLHWPF